jgi:hypothetical protein
MDFSLFLVAVAGWNHAFPFRIDALNIPAPKILGPKGPGKIGRRQNIEPVLNARVFCYLSVLRFWLSRSSRFSRLIIRRPKARRKACARPIGCSG